MLPSGKTNKKRKLSASVSGSSEGDESSRNIFNIDKKSFSKWYSEILKTADLVDLRYDVKGFIVYRPWLMRMVKLLYSLWETELEKRGHSPTLFPVVIPEENFEREKAHVQGFSPQVFWITQAGDTELENKLALRPTSETAFYQMYSLWIRSHADLPLKLYQSCAVYRYETKATKPLIRGREFLWIEAHDVFVSEKEALEQVRQDMETTKSVLLNSLGVPFVFLRRPAFDKFAGAVDTYAADALMPDNRALQLPSTHYLGQGFAKAFGLQYEDEDGKKRTPYQTCYGPPISRTLAAVVSIHGDRKGLVLPFSIAPIQVVIVPIIYKEREQAILERCRQLLSILESANLRVKLDDSDRKPGAKFYFWEMKGVPVRAEIGPRDLDANTITLVRRDTGDKKTVPFENATEQVLQLSQLMLENIRRKAQEEFDQRFSRAETLDELRRILSEKGGFVLVPFCSREKEGEECAEVIKEETDGEVRGTIFEDKEKVENKTCISCGKPATCTVLVARAY